MDLSAAGLHLRPALQAAGYTDAELRRAVHAGVLAPVRRGAYLSGEPPSMVEARHALEVQAAKEHLAVDAVVSHVSAAVLLGLPIWALDTSRVHVTRDRGYGGRRGRCVHVHVAPVAPDECGAVAGVLVTAPARTVVDIARTVPHEQAVVVADAALHVGLTDPSALAAALNRAQGWPGVPAARRALGFADGRSASVGESRSRVAIARAGLPAPQLQWEVRCAGGDVFWTDFGWPERRCVGEFDGRAKYGRLLRPGETAADAVYREKLREDAIRTQGLRVARWTWDELADFEPVAERIRRLFRDPRTP